MDTADRHAFGQDDCNAALQARYDQLWSGAIDRVEANDIVADPVLRSRKPDQRRGLTLIARPGADVQHAVAGFLQELKALEPEQYYYDASEIHVTILALFTATTEHARFLARGEAYMEAADAALLEAAPMKIVFSGVTATPATVLIQGFTSAKLNQLRDNLRRELRIRGLDEGVDVRYRLATAHMTVARFCEPLRHPGNFASTLKRSRGRAFGACVVRSLHLVESDWYMSRDVTKQLKSYQLGEARSAQG